ncbi:MAG TPA: imidazolonepropionase [Ignavibacteriaceae bacterium]|nr:imidazolonepropionase [Ignavibacteriaceae bacterium]
MITLLKNPAQIVTVNTDGKNFKRGKELAEIGVVSEHSIVVEDDLIVDVIPNISADKTGADKIIDLENKVILPGLIECHTHSVFAGSRGNEFRLKLKGVTYEEIAASGGGINSTVKAVRNASFDELYAITKERVDYFISQGITTLEIKSGYGLDFENEIKILNVIKKLNEQYPVDIVPTFLGAHTVPNELKGNREKYIDSLINEMLPYIASNNLAEFCDAFCEPGAFSADEVDAIFSSAVKHGFKIKLHTEQFNNIGGLDTALKHNAISVDHLEVIKNTDIVKLSGIDTVAVLLPGVSFFLNYGFAPARELIENDAIVALATDYNPGSSHIANLNLIMSFAALKMKMSIEETISAVTINAAKSLNRNKTTGSIEKGKKADFAVFNTNDYSDIVYNVGKNLNCMTIKDGKIIYSANGAVK